LVHYIFLYQIATSASRFSDFPFPFQCCGQQGTSQLVEVDLKLLPSRKAPPRVSQGSKYQPDKGQNISQTRVKISVRQGSKYQPDKGQNISQTRVKISVRQGSKYQPDKGQNISQTRVKISARQGSKYQSDTPLASVNCTYMQQTNCETCSSKHCS